MEIGILTAFVGGIISFLSPCVLPLVPPYLAYLGGTTLDRISGEEAEVDPRLARYVFISACFFVLGLATVFVALGMGASALGQALVRYKVEFATGAGFVIYVFGQHFIGLRRAPWVLGAVLAVLALWFYAAEEGFAAAALEYKWRLAGLTALAAALWLSGLNKLPILDREARFEGPSRAGGLGTSYVIGVAFAFGWTPCIGPILGTILALAAQEETILSGTTLLAVYSLGLGVPFLIAAAFIGPFLRWARAFRRHMGLVEQIMGAMLIVVGVMMITGQFERMAYWLLETFPVLGSIG